MSEVSEPLGASSKDEFRAKLIDRLFARFAAMYGKAWFDCWIDAPMADIKDAWMTGLSGFSVYRVRGALETALVQCKFPPSLPEFAMLCQAAKPDPADCVKPEPRLALPQSTRPSLLESERRNDSRDWARCILKRMSNGEHVPMIAEQFAKEALQAPGAKP